MYEDFVRKDLWNPALCVHKIENLCYLNGTKTKKNFQWNEIWTECCPVSVQLLTGHILKYKSATRCLSRESPTSVFLLRSGSILCLWGRRRKWCTSSERAFWWIYRLLSIFRQAAKYERLQQYNVIGNWNQLSISCAQKCLTWQFIDTWRQKQSSWVGRERVKERRTRNHWLWWSGHCS